MLNIPRNALVFVGDAGLEIMKQPINLTAQRFEGLPVRRLGGLSSRWRFRIDG